MCGLYGFQKGSGRPNLSLLAHLAALAAQRGPHAHGHATAGQRRVSLGGLKFCEVSTVVDSLVGHTRLATSGRYDDPAEAQPIQAGKLFVAHNGTVPGAGLYAERLNLTLMTDNDSEVLALVLARATNLSGIAATLDLLTPGVPLALLVLEPSGAVVAARRGHPLYVSRRAEGVYFCSLPFENSELLTDCTVTRFSAGLEEIHPLSTTTNLRTVQGGPAWRL